MADFLINVVVNTTGATRGVQQVDRSLSTIEASLRRIQTLVGAAFAFQAALSGVRAITDLADTLTNATNRLRSLGIEGSRTAAVTQELFNIANNSRQAFGGVAEVFARVQQTLGSLGAEQQEVINFTRTLTQAVAISGATTSEAEGALRQFTQGLAANRLSGQELNSVLEQLPILAQIIANELGVTTGELRGLANQGLITSDVLRVAVAGAADEIAARFGQTIPTISQSLVVLANRAIEVGGGFLTTSGAASALAQGILSLADNLETALRVAGAFAGFLITVVAGRAIPLVLTGLRTLAVAALKNPFTAIAVGAVAAVNALASFSDQIRFTNDGVATLADVGLAAISRFREVFVTGFNAIISLINQFIPSFDVINVSLEDLARGAAGFLDIVVAAFSGAIAAIIATFDNFGPVLQDTFISSLNGVIAIIERGLELIISPFIGLGGRLVDAASDALSSFGAALVSGFNTIVDFVSTIPQRIVDGLAGLTGAGAGAGAGLVDSIVQGIDDAVDVNQGQVEISLGRLENPAAGALAEVGQVAGDAFSQTLGNAPVTEELEGVLEDARVRASARANDVGTEIGLEVGEGLNVGITRSQAAFDAALANLFGRFSQFSDIGEQELQNFADNFGTILGGIDVASFVGNFIDNLATALGVAGTDLANAFSGTLAILDELGFELSDAIGSDGVRAVQLLGAVSSEEFTSIIRLLGSIITTVGSTIAAWLGYGTTATAANTSIATSGAAATAATASTGVAATGASAAFTTLGTVLSGIGTVIATVFNAILAGIVAIAETIASVLTIIAAAIAEVITVLAQALAFAIVELLTALAIGLTVLGEAALASAAGLAVAGIFLLVVAAAAIVVAIAIVLITEAVIKFTEFLFETAAELDTFFNDIADGIDTLIRRIGESVTLLIDTIVGNFEDLINVVPRLIQALIDAILDIFRSLGEGLEEIVQILIDTIVGIFRRLAEGIEEIVGLLVDTVVGLFRRLGEGIAEIIQIAVDLIVSIFEGLGEAVVAIINSIGAAIAAVIDIVVDLFEGLGRIIVAIFETVGAVISAVFNTMADAAEALGRIITAVFNALGAAIEAIFRTIGAVASGVFADILSFGSRLISALVNFFADLLSAVIRVFGEILATGIKVLAELIRLLRQIIGLLREIIALAKEAGEAIGGIGLGGGGGGGGGGIGGIIGGIGKGIGGLFAEGGVITEPVSLAGPGMGGNAFASGGVIPSLTFLGDSSSVSSGSQLGIAGEAGPEAILPLTSTSNGLGVTSVLPPDVTALLKASIDRLGDDSGRQAQVTNVVQKVVVIETSNQTVQDLRKELDAVDATVEQRADVRIAEVLEEALA